MEGYHLRFQTVPSWRPGIRVGHASTPVARGVPPGPHQSDMSLTTRPPLVEKEVTEENFSHVNSA